MRNDLLLFKSDHHQMCRIRQHIFRKGAVVVLSAGITGSQIIVQVGLIAVSEGMGIVDAGSLVVISAFLKQLRNIEIVAQFDLRIVHIKFYFLEVFVFQLFLREIFIVSQRIVVIRPRQLLYIDFDADGQHIRGKAVYHASLCRAVTAENEIDDKIFIVSVHDFHEPILIIIPDTVVLKNNLAALQIIG